MTSLYVIAVVVKLQRNKSIIRGLKRYLDKISRKVIFGLFTVADLRRSSMNQGVPTHDLFRSFHSTFLPQRDWL